MLLGCIADDFTGASDAASFLVKGGMQTLLLNGVPENINEDDVAQADAVVIALKTRTQETTSAVADSVNSIKWLKAHGAKHFYVKYCSTFDSTPEGNIGPINDAVMEYLQVDHTLLCPSLPVNGRIVKDGTLYVNGVPLAESHMKNHPLTPMHESNIALLMKPQSKYASYELGVEQDWSEKIQQLQSEGKAFYLIPDYETDGDAKKIVEFFGDEVLLTGGSGLLTAWGEYLCHGKQEDEPALFGTEGQGLLLAGSCSKATLAQIAYSQKSGVASYKLKPAEILSGQQGLDDVRAFIDSHPNEAVLIYSSETPEYLESIRGTDLPAFSAALEKMMADIAVMARDNGITRIIVAGGETSGAVTKALDYSAYWIGPSIAPGVPMMAPVEKQDLRLVLKSGNFGQEDFFQRALDLTGKN